jgi:hypothetical protein
MASFGTKEHWMEPMNAFLTQHRESFKSFIDDVCYVPTPLSTAIYPSSTASSPTYPAAVPSAETHLSYGTPMTIMQRLPPTSREGFPSLPYLIDQARAFADLVQLWLEITLPANAPDGASTSSSKRHSDVMHAINSSEGDLQSFHRICVTLNIRTQECLSRAERAERPNSELSFRWEELINQLQSNNIADSGDEAPTQLSYDSMTDKSDNPSLLPPGMQGRTIDVPGPRDWQPVTDEEEDEDAHATRLYDPTPPVSAAMPNFDFASLHNTRESPRESPRDRPGSASMSSSLHGSLRRMTQSRGSDHSQLASASASNVSSAVSSDTEHTPGPTALPSYEREIRHRERRDAAERKIRMQMDEAKLRDQEKERRRVKTPLAALKRKKDREGRGSLGSSRGSGNTSNV